MWPEERAGKGEGDNIPSMDDGGEGRRMIDEGVSMLVLPGPTMTTTIQRQHLGEKLMEAHGSGSRGAILRGVRRERPE